VHTIQHTLTTQFVEALVDGLMTLVTLVMMLIYSRKLAVISVCVAAAYVLLRVLSYRPLREATEQQLMAAARRESHFLESVRGMQSIKIALLESRRRSAYLNLLNDTVNREAHLLKLDLGFGSASQLLFGAERIAVIWLGASLVIKSTFSVGMLVAYLAYRDQFAARIAGLIDKCIQFWTLRVHTERLADIVWTAPEEQQIMPETGLPERADLKVHELSFRYAEGEPWILQQCSLEVAPGESIAIVGASGCGKTTLIKLMLGLLTPSSGKISTGGVDIAKLGHKQYRQLVAAVMQDDQLFAGSIAENIALGDDGYDQARVEEAAKLAAVHEDIAAMPMGYHSLIGDMGSTLSGGQKQRVLLARALYRKPRLLFLDEATSHMDVAREQLVNAGLRAQRVTKIIVAHRPETIAAADRVLVMHEGRIVMEERVGRPTQPAAQAAPVTSEATANGHAAS